MGIFDWISKKEMEHCLVKELINDFRDLVIYCNFHPTKIHFVQSKHPYDKERIMDSYQIEISGNLNIIDSRYPPKASRLKTRNKIRQFNTTGETNFRKHANDYIGFAKIKSIDYVGVEPVFDIEVENYHNFIADGIVVHN